MSDSQDSNKQDHDLSVDSATDGETEELMYEEPPAMTLKDNLGVAFALVALAVIGYLGYVWLTPGKNIASIFSKADSAEVGNYSGLAEKWNVTSTPAPVDHSTMEMDGHDLAKMDSQPEMAENTGDAGATPEPIASPMPHQHDHEMNCPYCGMFADKSESHISAEWTDGTHTHHDCWDCAFLFGMENGLGLASATVALLGSPPSNPDWIDAQVAWFLYDTDKSVPGSMPPFVAAFATKDAAQAHQADWGGELVDFLGLQAKWD